MWDFELISSTDDDNVKVTKIIKICKNGVHQSGIILEFLGGWRHPPEDDKIVYYIYGCKDNLNSGR